MKFRITSYNVCYTKLLRVLIKCNTSKTEQDLINLRSYIESSSELDKTLVLSKIADVKAELGDASTKSDLDIT